MNFRVSRRLALALVSGLLGFSPLLPPARADEASKAALIEEMFVLTKLDALLRQMMEQVQTAQKTQFQKMSLPAEARAGADEIQEQIMAVVRERLSWGKLKPLYAKLYADTFTEEELHAAVDFYRSPAGKAMLEKMPLLMTVSMKMVQEQLGDLTPEVKRIIEEQEERWREEQENKANRPKTS